MIWGKTYWPKYSVQWRKVSAGDIRVYVPLNAPIAVPSRQTTATAWATLRARWEVTDCRRSDKTVEFDSMSQKTGYNVSTKVRLKTQKTYLGDMRHWYTVLCGIVPMLAWTCCCVIAVASPWHLSGLLVVFVVIVWIRSCHHCHCCNPGGLHSTHYPNDLRTQNSSHITEMIWSWSWVDRPPQLHEWRWGWDESVDRRTSSDGAELKDSLQSWHMHQIWDHTRGNAYLSSELHRHPILVRLVGLQNTWNWTYKGWLRRTYLGCSTT